MNAQKLVVTANALNPELDEDAINTGEYTFPVWEFENGVILVPSETTNDYFFNSREEIEANGLDVVVSVEATGEYIEWSIEEIDEAIAGYQDEFGATDDDIAKMKELIA